MQPRYKSGKSRAKTKATLCICVQTKLPSFSELERTSPQIITGSWFHGQNSPNVVAGGGERRGISFVWRHFLCGSALKRDYITSIVASEPSAFIHWLMYGGPSDPHKERAFQQFSKQEVWTQYSHLITVKLIDPVSHWRKKTLARKKTPAGKLSSNHLTGDDELTNTGQTHHSFKTHGASSFYCVKPHTHIYESFSVCSRSMENLALWLTFHVCAPDHPGTLLKVSLVCPLVGAQG